jgi:hypothetical protein
MGKGQSAWRIAISAAKREKTTEDRRQRSEVRGRWTGFKVISDLRLLTSGIDGFNYLNDVTN